MTVREMAISDIASVLPIYIEYYNEQEDGCWTSESAGRRIRQVLSTQDSYSLLLEEEGAVIGFAMGYFKQYDDVIGYTLEEILIASKHQKKGVGTKFLKELEQRVKEKGAACVKLQAVNDEYHEKYYGRAGYHNAKNFLVNVKWFE